MRETQVIVTLEEEELTLKAGIAFGERDHASPDRGDMLAKGQIEALYKSRINLPTTTVQYLIDLISTAKDHALNKPDQTPASAFLNDLRIQ